MKNKKLIIIVGESTGFECLKNIINTKIFRIALVISTDKNYHYPIKRICKKYKINYMNSKNFKNFSKHIKFNNKKKYILISIFSNLILKNNFLKKFNRSAYNVHPGLLPYYPGKNCVSGALYNNEKITGVTLHKMTSKIDHGSIVKQYKIKIQREDNLLKLMKKLRLCTVKLINSFMKDLNLNKKISLKKNNIKLIKLFPKEIPNEGLVNFKTKYSEFKRLYKSSYFGPFHNTWGRINFFHINKKFYITDVIKVKSSPNKIITDKTKSSRKIKKNLFDIRVQNKIITVSTS